MRVRTHLPCLWPPHSFSITLGLIVVGALPHAPACFFPHVPHSGFLSGYTCPGNAPRCALTRHRTLQKNDLFVDSNISPHCMHGCNRRLFQTFPSVTMHLAYQTLDTGTRRYYYKLRRSCRKASVFQSPLLTAVGRRVGLARSGTHHQPPLLPPAATTREPSSRLPPRTQRGPNCIGRLRTCACG